MRVCVFTGASRGLRPAHATATALFGAELCRRGHGLVYGGGHVGLMGVLADSVLESGGEVIGVIPRNLMDRELAHSRVTDLQVVPDMHSRKARMAEQADAFVALPGGIGTLEELFEVWTWAQLGLHNKPIGLLNVDGFFDHLLVFCDLMVADGFLPAESRARLVVSDAADALLVGLARSTARL
ncbi:MAG: TIGR00730 family Rossman fold protein [Actinomycetota bacterium]|nr:TIGR00730 family Rossman fold protein [Actinomycetota bacterium]